MLSGGTQVCFKLAFVLRTVEDAGPYRYFLCLSVTDRRGRRSLQVHFLFRLISLFFNSSSANLYRTMRLSRGFRIINEKRPRYCEDAFCWCSIGESELAQSAYLGSICLFCLPLAPVGFRWNPKSFVSLRKTKRTNKSQGTCSFFWCSIGESNSGHHD